MTFEEVLAKHRLDPPACMSGVGDGWSDLLDRMFTRLDEVGWSRKLGQVKEKFGFLRIYVDEWKDGIHGDDWDIVQKAEEESTSICEECGAEGDMRNSGACSYWIKTLCDSCFAKLNEERGHATGSSTSKIG